jgi:hypothetical protein
MLLDQLKYPYVFDSLDNIQDGDIIYSPGMQFDTSKYPTNKFIFGPHFSVFPSNKLFFINNIHNNSVYIQPSLWVKELWKPAETYIPVKSFPFPVDINTFNNISTVSKNKVFIYFKRRHPNELHFLTHFLKERDIEYHIFDYIQKYNESDYLTYLHKSKYGIILDAHESQGFAIEEALSCNVPLLVWNTRVMSQEHNSKYADIPCTSIPYWDDRCGEYFYRAEQLEQTFNTFIQKIDTYEPRQYIMDTLSPKKCAENFVSLINSIG